MLKINYPDRKRLNVAYLNFFSKKIKPLKLEFDCFLRQKEREKLTVILKKVCLIYQKRELTEDNIFEYILTASFEELREIIDEIENEDFWKDDKEDLKKMFDYGKLSTKIRNFFIKNLTLNTCYYCNIDYINNLEITVKKDTETKQYGLFQLDHFLAKSIYPLFALSLYNFVPSCATCNAKLKGATEFKTKLSPTSEDFKYDDCVKFKLFFKKEDKGFCLTKTETSLTYSGNKDNYKQYEDNYKEYEAIFKTNDRYAFHNREVKELLEKRTRYTDKYLEDIVKALNYDIKSIEGKVLFHQLKRDIFGKEIFDKTPAETKPFTKLKRDIAKDIGLK